MSDKSVLRFYRRQRERAVEYLGGKCQKCGYDRCIAALQFHHRDPAEKEFTISGRTISWKRLQPELDKCDLLCANCHAELHFEHMDLSIRTKKLVEKECPACHCAFRPSKAQQVYCSHGCARSVARKCQQRPSKDELRQLLETRSFVAVGKIYGVSDNTIRKWLK